MVTKTYCDRCGDELKRSVKYNIAIRFVIDEIMQDDEQYKELCSDCYKLLDGFLNGDC